MQDFKPWLRVCLEVRERKRKEGKIIKKESREKIEEKMRGKLNRDLIIFLPLL